MKILNTLLFFALFCTLSSAAQYHISSNDIVNINTDSSTSNWVEMEIIDGCLDIEIDDETVDGIHSTVPSFRISLNEEQIALDQSFGLEITNGVKTLLSGTLNANASKTPPIIFSDVELGIYMINLKDNAGNSVCMMKISFKETD